MTGDGRADIVGFGDAGVWVALNNGNGTFAAPKLAVDNFGYTAGGWRVACPESSTGVAGKHRGLESAC